MFITCKCQLSDNVDVTKTEKLWRSLDNNEFVCIMLLTQKNIPYVININ